MCALVKESRMFPFINKTWNPIAGGCFIENEEIFACPYRCVYCWARILINKFPGGNLGKKYSGPYRIHEKAINQKFKPGDFVAVQFMSDIGAPGIPRDVVELVLDEIRDHPTGVRFLLLTKSDKFYKEYTHSIPSKCVCGITMETDLVIPKELRVAPKPGKRLDGLVSLKSYFPYIDTFVSIEPIMPFSETFLGNILKANPWAVAVGYDNYKNDLPEPRLAKTQTLIEGLIDAGVTVYEKGMRKAWNET